jgi:actin-related protein
MDPSHRTPLTLQPVVIDNGSGFIKAGFAGGEQPKVWIPS